MRADQHLSAESIEYDIPKDSALAKGNVHFEDATNIFYATEATADLAKDSTTLTSVRILPEPRDPWETKHRPREHAPSDIRGRCRASVSA